MKLHMRDLEEKPMHLFVAVRLSCLAALGLIACSCGGTRTEAAKSDNAAKTPDTTLIVPVTKVFRKSLSSEITLTAEFVPYQEIDVMAKVAGYVRSINVDIGDRVRAGQILAELEVPEMRDDMAKAVASVEASEAEIATARDEVMRAKSAHDMTHLSFTRIQEVMRREPGLIPQQELDEIHAKDLVSEAELSATESKLNASERKAAMSRAERARWGTLQNYTSISAPFAGVITKRYANTGSMVQAGTASQTQAMPVVRLAQIDILRLILPIPESAVPSIRVGETVDVTVASLGKTFTGCITRFAHEVNASTRTMETEVDVSNTSRVLVPGLYAEVKLQLTQNHDVLVLPLDAVEEASGSPQVFAVRGSTIAVVPVTVGTRTAQLEEIRSGVHEGDLVIVGRHAGLQNGETVQPKLVDASGDNPNAIPKTSKPGQGG